MGLDMYLYAVRTDGPTIEEYHAAMDVAWAAGGLDKYREAKEAARVEVAYWRKANEIHAWFVDNFQDGVDECNPSKPISREALAGLVARCQRVLDGDADPEDVLPTRAGFFFGTYEYDEWYEQDMKNTIEQLTPLITDTSIDHFIYQSSW